MNSESIMQNDTVTGSPPLTREDLGRMRELAGYSINRRDAELWAQNDIKFLVYDDSAALERGYNSDDERGILEFALRLSDMTTNADDDKLADETKVASSKPSKKKSTCFCEAAASFPKTFHPTELKLFRPENSMSCDHYIAVSYCWPSEDHGNEMNAEHSSTQEYQVRDLNGVVRPARAPDWVLRRAIEVAASCDINMIWIDQECLPQPTDNSTQSETDEQQKGIQAMDIIYSRAAVTAGLLSNARLASQRHMDALAAFQAWEIKSDVGKEGQLVSKTQTESDVDEATMHLVMDVFESIITDRYYTRAWITQEALSAGSSLVLVLAGGDIVKQPDFHLKTSEPSKPVLWRSMSSEIYVMPMDVLHTTLTLSEKLLPLSIQPRPNRPPANIRTIHRSIPIINRTREFNIRFSNRGGEESQLLMGAGDKAAVSRCTIDAASALGLLSSRGCRNVEDRIAIVANMCNFHVRLDTHVMARQCKSLKLALLTLAIANGDYSLLVPEAFAVEHEIKPAEAYNRWLWPFDQALDRIDHRHSQSSGLVCPFIYSHQEAFSAAGIRLSANIWEVKDKIDMRPIQHTWSHKWDRLTRIQAHFTPKNVEGAANYVRGYVSMRKRDPKDAHFYEQMKLMGNFIEHPGEWPYGVKVTKPLLDIDREGQKDLGDMIFAVIIRLYEMRKHDGCSDTASYALSLANALWHSVRATVEPISALPDIVGDWLYHHKGLERNSYEMLDLASTPDGNVAQAWFLERIMRDGYLWAGRYVASTTTNRQIADAARIMDSLQPRGEPKLNPRNPIAMRQIARNRAASFGRFLHSNNSPAPARHTTMDDRKSAVVTEIHFYREWSDEDETRRGRDCAALFDVDGPCTVAVPFNGAWEVLPRPTTRSMSICWVVEKSLSKGKEKNEKNGSKEEDDEEEFQVVKKVKGLFECMNMPRGRYIFT